MTAIAQVPTRTIEDQYPSTYDCEVLAVAHDDLTLRCMENARTRLAVGHVTNDGYVEEDRGKVAVCAVGAVLYVDGIREEDVDKAETTTGIGSLFGMELMQALDAQLSTEAKEAIELLNAAALEMHPEAKDYGSWSGPLEWVNEEWYPTVAGRGDFDDLAEERLVKAEVLCIYDRAIDQRRRALSPG